MMALRRDLSTMPEYVPDKIASIADPSVPLPSIGLVGGDFAALGNPSSFHLEAVRRYRDVCNNIMEMVLKAYR